MTDEQEQELERIAIEVEHLPENPARVEFYRRIRLTYPQDCANIISEVRDG